MERRTGMGWRVGGLRWRRMEGNRLVTDEEMKFTAQILYYK
jgi:hypothetical protein